MFLFFKGLRMCIARGREESAVRILMVSLTRQEAVGDSLMLARGLQGNVTFP